MTRLIQVLLPLLELTISIPGANCFDTEIHVRARPFPRLDVERDAIAWDPDPPVADNFVLYSPLGSA